MEVLLAVDAAVTVTAASTVKLTLSICRIKVTSWARRPFAAIGQSENTSSLTSPGAKISTRPGAFKLISLLARVVETLAEP